MSTTEETTEEEPRVREGSPRRKRSRGSRNKKRQEAKQAEVVVAPAIDELLPVKRTPYWSIVSRDQMSKANTEIALPYTRAQLALAPLDGLAFNVRVRSKMIHSNIKYERQRGDVRGD